MRKRSVLDLKRITRQEFKQIEKIPLVIVLDHIRSLNNVGSVFRTSDAFLIESIFLCGITATPPHPEIHKTALGAEDSVEWHYEEDTCKAVTDLKNSGYTVFAIEQVENSVSLPDLIPQFGTKHSLNVSVTAGLIIWDFFKQLYY